jgi:acyl-CoA hydrolase
MTRFFDDVGPCVEETLRRVGPRVVLALPLGIGKPNPLANEFYRRAERDPAIDLTIITALSLERPHAGSGLERRLVEPMVERIFGNYPELAYVTAQRRGALPPNIRVIEFYLEPGKWLNSPDAQRDYLSSNYPHVARDALARGVNVIAQLVAKREVQGRTMLSLGSNPDVTLDLLPMLDAVRAAGREVVVIGEVHGAMPYMLGPAELEASRFDYLVEHPRYDYELYAPPNLPLQTTDHAIALHASTLVRDGGTLQIGIGEIGDALVYALLLRHRENAAWRAAVTAIGGRVPADEVFSGPFREGLYACTEMLVDLMLDLRRAGILVRRVYDDLPLMRLLASGQMPDESANEALQSGVVAHASFFLGPRAFYAALREMPEQERRLFEMRGVGFVNQLYGPDLELRVLQRRHARFINTAMLMTLSGAAVSDGLEDGRVVSGVGGQYNFVAMAHALPDAQSILCVRATRTKDGRVTSNIVPRYGHTTIARHLRDVVVTEYGIAELRGRTDAEVSEALVAIADARFQDQLRTSAERAHKWPTRTGSQTGTRDPARESPRNSPARLEAAFASRRSAGLFPEYPFGTDLTAEEIVLARALKHLASTTGTFAGRLRTVAASLLADGDPSAADRGALERMALAAPRGWREHLDRRLLLGALRAVRASRP